MAGQGKKTFSDGEVLSAADVNGYLMDQSVMRFADSAARTAAIGTPTEGMVTYLDDVNQIEVYDGTAWVDQQAPILSEGTAGQYLQSNGTAGSTWVDAEFVGDIITTQGDLVIGDASGDAVRLPVGAADTVLTSDGTTAVWSAAAGGGGGQNFVNLEFNKLAAIDVDFPANSVVRFAVITTSTNTFEVSVFDSSDNKIDNVNVDRDNPFTYFTNATAIAKLGVGNTVVDETAILVFTDPTAASSPTTSQNFINVTSTQSVTLDTTYEAYIFGAGGGGGGARDDFAGGGGGSGYFATATFAAGTYTATIGAGGNGGVSSGGTGADGGNTSFDVTTANGGKGAGGASNSISNGDGGDGGSGGGGGAVTDTKFTGGFGGANGASGTNGKNTVGGAGSGITLPDSNFAETSLLVPGSATTTYSAAGQFYCGGNGGRGNTFINGGNASFNGGGGGASGDVLRSGGKGGDGFILLVEVV